MTKRIEFRSTSDKTEEEDEVKDGQEDEIGEEGLVESELEEEENPEEEDAGEYVEKEVDRRNITCSIDGANRLCLAAWSR